MAKIPFKNKRVMDGCKKKKYKIKCLHRSVSDKMTLATPPVYCYIIFALFSSHSLQKKKSFKHRIYKKKRKEGIIKNHPLVQHNTCVEGLK